MARTKAQTFATKRSAEGGRSGHTLSTKRTPSARLPSHTITDRRVRPRRIVVHGPHAARLHTDPTGPAVPVREEGGGVEEEAVGRQVGRVHGAASEHVAVRGQRRPTKEPQTHRVGPNRDRRCKRHMGHILYHENPVNF